MKCDHCGADNPVVHLTEVEDNETRTLHLCAGCAEARGISESPIPENFLLAGVLAQLGTESTRESSTSGDARETSPACSFCGLTLREFKESGRLGCPHCWSSFDARLRPLLDRIHGAPQHTGKVYLPPDPSASELEKRLDGLRRKLERAVDMEDFERAAELRDRIRTLQATAVGG